MFDVKLQKRLTFSSNIKHLSNEMYSIWSHNTRLVRREFRLEIYVNLRGDEVSPDERISFNT